MGATSGRDGVLSVLVGKGPQLANLAGSRELSVGGHEKVPTRGHE